MKLDHVSVLGMLVMAVLAGSALAQNDDPSLLLFDGFKVAPAGVSQSQTNIYVNAGGQGITGGNMEAAEIIGFKTAAWAYPKMGVTNTAPVLPEYYTEAVRWNNGAMYRYDATWNHEIHESRTKWVKRDFSTEVSERLPQEDVLYFRVLLTFTRTTLFNALTKEHACQGMNAFGAGYGTVVTGMQEVNDADGQPNESEASMLFLFSTTRPTDKDPETGNLVFRVSDTNHFANVSTNGMEYVLVENPTPNVTYLCMAEVRPDQGENGKDLVRARAVALDEEFGKHLPVDAEQFFTGCPVISDFDLVGPNDGEHLRNALCGGKMYTALWNSKNPTAVFYDEFGIATKFKTLCPTGVASTMVILR